MKHFEIHVLLQSEKYVVLPYVHKGSIWKQLNKAHKYLTLKIWENIGHCRTYLKNDLETDKIELKCTAQAHTVLRILLK